MSTSSSRPGRFRPSLSFVLLGALLLVLWIAGGASRADALGQPVVRGAATAILVIAILFAEPVRFGSARPVWLVLIAAIMLPLIQLIPLPPILWQALPGRSLFVEAAAASGQTQPWRPWSIVPGATLNAAASLLVPLATLVLATGLRDDERRMLPGMMLLAVIASAVLGLLQLSGAGFDNPFINDSPGIMSGSFANRNHFALFLAVGCILVPAWAFPSGRRAHWRAGAGLGLLLLFVLTILATGSRAGIMLGVVATGIAILIARHSIREELRRAPRWALPAALAAIVVIILLFIALSVTADRAASIRRALDLDAEQDLRRIALPTVLATIRAYFPFGSGLGAFDPIFRIHEPFSLLRPTYFNHAHNDFLEIVLDAGLPGLSVLVAALFWWAVASLRAWRAIPGSQGSIQKIGSGILLLITLASIVDYPARTPMIMAVAILAGLCLTQERRQAR